VPTYQTLGARSERAAMIVGRCGAFSGDSEHDLALLQRAIDEPALPPHDTLGWQSLGIAFGAILVRELGLHWVMVDDEYGRDPALRFSNTDTLVFPLTMISKRIERGERPDVRWLLEAARNDLKQRRHRGPQPS
jgi:uncharacterized protein DUF3806